MRCGDGGDLLKAVDLRGALTHRHDMRTHPEGLRHPPLQGAGAAGLDKGDPHDALLTGARQETRDGGARDPQVVSDHLHRLALDVVHGGRLVGAHETARVGCARRAPDGVSGVCAGHVVLLRPSPPPGSPAPQEGLIPILQGSGQPPQGQMSRS